MLYFLSAIHMVGHRIAVRNAIAKEDEVEVEAEEVEMKIEVAIDMEAEAEVVEVAVVLMEIVARTGLK